MRQIDKPAFKTYFAQEAAHYFEKVLSVQPKSDSAKVYLAATLLFGGLGNSPMEAVGMLKGVLDQNKHFTFAHKTLGLASFASGQYEKAIERFLFVQKQNPFDIENLLLLGETYERLHQNKKAKEVYQSIIGYTKYQELKEQLTKKSIRYHKHTSFL